MKRVLSGVQPSGRIHLGNYLGAIRQHIEMQKDHECFYMIADLHALTTIRDPKEMRTITTELIAGYIALGLDPEKTVFFRQSDIPEHTELTWIFSCITKMPYIERAHAWKDAQAKGKKDSSVGLFTYPILQAADILLYNADLVPVGQDQKQHIEMTRDIGQNFNNIFGETFKIPEAYIKKEVAIVPGTDGQKMSKSYGNTIDIFAPEKELKKQVMSIITASVPLEDPKDPKSCNVFKLYKHIATPKEAKALEKQYIGGNFGYGEAKKILFEKLLDYFGSAREKYQQVVENKDVLTKVIEKGNLRAKEVATATLSEVKTKIGYQ